MAFNYWCLIIWLILQGYHPPKKKFGVKVPCFMHQGLSLPEARERKKLGSTK